MTPQPTISIVDDDPAIRESLSALLLSHGMDVHAYADAGDFLEHYDPHPRECFILDVRMPGMSGVELMHELRRRGIGTPIVFITGHGSVPEVRAMADPGSVALLEKPYSEASLIGAIEHAVGADDPHCRCAGGGA